MICKQVPNPESLIILPRNEMDHLKEESTQYSLEQILYSLDILQHAFARLRSGASRRLEMEMTLMKLCTPSLDSTPQALLRRIKVLEESVKSGVTPANTVRTLPKVQTPPVKEETKEPAKAAPVEKEESSKPTDSSESKPFLQWGEVLQILKTESPPLYGGLVESTAFIVRQTVVIQSRLQVTKALISSKGNLKTIQGAIMRVTGNNYQIGYKQMDEPKLEEEASPLSQFIKNSTAGGLTIDLKGE